MISSPKSECSIRVIPIPQFILDIITKEDLYRRDAYLLTREVIMIRHTFASDCIEAGVDAKSISEILGHSSVNITLNRFVHSRLNLQT